MFYSNTTTRRTGSENPLRGIRKRFGDLEVRPKLMILHNLFFLLLAAAVYLTVMSALEAQIGKARLREMALVNEALRSGVTIKVEDSSAFQYEQGTLDRIGVPGEGVRWLADHPKGVWASPPERTVGYVRREPGIYGRLTLDGAPYKETLRQARWTLFAVLGLLYALAVLALEFLIMPTYVYRPLRLMLRADDATRQGVRERELIPEQLILGDEIGQIMRSRNETVAELRRREDELATALTERESLNHDLERKNAMLEAARENLLAQDRLASLGLLSASVAHEMNTPLAVLKGSIEQFAEITEGQAAQERIARMLRVTGRLQTIGETLLDFARHRQPEIREVDLSQVIDDAWNLVHIDERAAQVTFKNELLGSSYVHGNEDRLHQVFVNLLRNSLAAVRPGGLIRVSGRRLQENGSECQEVVVEDNGPGFPEHLLSNVFEAFVTSRLDSKGTGLGLTVAEGIVEQHGGTIKAANRNGGGARIEVRLPIIAQEARR